MKIILTTYPKKKSKEMMKKILESKLAGCIVEIKDCNSKFWWKNKIDKAKENLLIIKTKRGLVNKLFKKIKDLHPYEVPFIAVVDIERVNKEYFEWLKNVI
jgi:periplasmic divalent cation tolerance protein